VSYKAQATRVLTRMNTVGGTALSLMSGLLSASLILYSSYVLYDTFYTQNRAFSSAWDLLDYRPEIIEDGAVPLSGSDKLAAINADYRAWLTMYDTKIDYPVMQGTDDLYYASHDIYGDNSLTGAIYLAAANTGDFSDNYNLVYGHHMDNGAMFGGLDSFKNPVYFSRHREGILVTADAVYDLNTFAVVQTDAYEPEIYTTGNRDLNGLITYLKGNMTQGSIAAAMEADKIIALSTCADAETDGRLVLLATMKKRSTQGAGGGGGSPDTIKEGTGSHVPTYPNGPDDSGDPDGSGGSGGTNDSDGPGGEDDGNGGNSDGGNDNSGSGSPDTDSIGGIAGGTGNPSGGDTPGGNDTPGGDEPNDNPGEELDDNEAPLSRFVMNFIPEGSTHGSRAWSLVNLLCLFFTAYILLPLMHLRAKYSRGKLMKKVNKAKQELREAKELRDQQLKERVQIEKTAIENRERNTDATESSPVLSMSSNSAVTENEFIEAVEILYYQVKKFMRRFRLGITVEAIDTVLSLLLFVATQDLRTPMVLIDRYTPIFVCVLLVSYVIDLRLARYRNRILAEELKDVEKQTAKVKAAT